MKLDKLCDLGVVTEPLGASLSSPDESEDLSEVRSPATAQRASRPRSGWGAGAPRPGAHPSKSAALPCHSGVSRGGGVGQLDAVDSWAHGGFPVLMPSATLVTCLRRAMQCILLSL